MIDTQGEDRGAVESALAALAQKLTIKKEKAVDHKRAAESRWIEDERQYWGIRSKRNDEDSDSDRPPIDNITRSKTDIAASRIGDMLFPTNDKNFALTASPEPLDIDGNPIDAAQAEKAVDRIERKVEDNLNACNYPKHGRQAIEDACRLGIGIIKGPFSKSGVKRVVRRSEVPAIDPMTGQPAVDPMTGEVIIEGYSVRSEIVRENRPASERVDPWTFFPLPCRSMDSCEGVYQLHHMPKSKLYEMRNWPGFSEEAIGRVMLENKGKPSYTGQESSLIRERQNLLESGQSNFQDYIVWEYRGAIDAELLQKIGFGELDGSLDMYWGEVWFSGSHVIKVEINSILGDERVPYYVFSYKRDDADILNAWGVPRLVREEQESVDILWEAIQYNAELCSGPQTTVKQGKIEPANGDYTIRGPKTWIIKSKDVNKSSDAIVHENIPSVVGQLLPIYDRAKQNANENTQLPMLAQGEAAQTQMTASGQAMIMNAQNIVQRRAAHGWDDDITIPMLTRYYWWEMEFGEDDDAKIEMQVVARGSSYLMVKDMQGQHGMLAMQLINGDPELRQAIKGVEMYKRVLGTLDFPTDDLWLSDEEIQQSAANPAAQMQQQAQEAELRKLMAEAAKAEAEAQAAASDQSAGREFEREEADRRLRDRELQVKLMIAEMDMNGKLADAASRENVSLAQIQKDLGIAEMRIEVDAYKAEIQAAQRETDSARRAENAAVKNQIDANREMSRKENLRLGRDSI